VVGGFKELKRNSKQKDTNKKNNFSSKIIGFILIILGFVFLFTSFSLHIKISVTLLFIGFVIILMASGKNKHKTINDSQLTLIIIIYTLVVWIITIDLEFDIFLISIIIGVIALKELLHTFLNPFLQQRMKFLFYVLLILFVILVVRRIINILSMYPGT